MRNKDLVKGYISRRMELRDLLCPVKTFNLIIDSSLAHRVVQLFSRAPLAKQGSLLDCVPCLEHQRGKQYSGYHKWSPEVIITKRTGSVAEAKRDLALLIRRSENQEEQIVNALLNFLLPAMKHPPRDPQTI